MFRKIVITLFTVFLAISFSTVAYGDGMEEDKTTNSPHKVEKLGVPSNKTITEVQGIYKLKDWEEDLNELINEVNELHPKFADLVQNQERLTVKPDGQPYQNLYTSLQELQKMVGKGVEKATTNEKAMKAIKQSETRKELIELQKKVDKRLTRLENYLLGPKQQSILVELDGQGYGKVEIELNNGQKIEARYAVGSDRQVTPDLKDHPVVVAYALPPNSTSEKQRNYTYGYGIAVQGESSVIVNFDPFPFDHEGAKWMATNVHNIGAKGWKYLQQSSPFAAPLAPNRHK